MKTVSAVRYDGKTSARVSVELSVSGDYLQISGQDFKLRYPLSDISVASRVGQLRAILQFTDGSICEISQPAALEELLPAQIAKKHSAIHRWENNFLYAIVALVFSVVTLWGLIEYAVPIMAKQAADIVPRKWETKMGDEVLSLLDSGILQPTALPSEIRHGLKQKFDKAAQTVFGDTLKIEFRSSPAIGPNALALPSGIIVFTDEMVKFAERDEELIGIFLHEVGHVKHRHVMRHILQNSVTALIIIVLTGDVSSASSLAATVPTLLVQSHFSRSFETEADVFAKQGMLQLGLSPVELAQIFQRLESISGASDDDNITDFLSTHPATQERINYLLEQ